MRMFESMRMETGRRVVVAGLEKKSISITRLKQRQTSMGVLQNKPLKRKVSRLRD